MSTVADESVVLVACSPNMVVHVVFRILLVRSGVVVWIVSIHDEWCVRQWTCELSKRLERERGTETLFWN